MKGLQLFIMLCLLGLSSCANMESMSENLESCTKCFTGIQQMDSYRSMTPVVREYVPVIPIE